MPEAGTVHHAASLEIVHAEFEVTVKLVTPATEVTFWFEGLTVSVEANAFWVTVTITSATPDAETVIVATR